LVKKVSRKGAKAQSKQGSIKVCSLKLIGFSVSLCVFAFAAVRVADDVDSFSLRLCGKTLLTT
jgi:hypothetical protein